MVSFPGSAVGARLGQFQLQQQQAGQQQERRSSSSSTRRSRGLLRDSLSCGGDDYPFDEEEEEDNIVLQQDDDDDRVYDPIGDSSSVVEGLMFPPDCQAYKGTSAAAAARSLGGVMPARLLEAFSCLCIGTAVGGTPGDYVETQEERMRVTKAATASAPNPYQLRRRTTNQATTTATTATSRSFFSGWPQLEMSSTSSSSPPAIQHSGSSSSSSNSTCSDTCSSRHQSAGERHQPPSTSSSSDPRMMITYPDGSASQRLVVPTTYVTDKRTGHLVRRQSQTRQGQQRRPCRSSYVFRPVTLAELQQNIDMVNSRSRSNPNSNGNQLNGSTRTRSNQTQDSLDSIYTVRLPEEGGRRYCDI